MNQPTKAAADHLGPASVAAYAKPDAASSLLNVATSVVPYLALVALMYVSLGISYFLTFALAVPAAGFLVRVFIVFHDCAHGSFFRSPQANAWLGRFCGLFVLAPYGAWRHDHAVHHATAGDLERRGTGDVPTYTVAEYRAMPFRKRLAYRLFRNPLVMFGLGPIWAMIISPRVPARSMRKRMARSILLTDVTLVGVIGSLSLLLGWRDLLLIQLPPMLLAGSLGVWLFYVQHQFEDTYWKSSAEWSYADAALQGSSYLRLHQPLQFFSGNIGLHHVHHLSAKVPNYKLQRAHDATPALQAVPTLSLADGLRATRLKLWDEESSRLVSFAEAAKARPDAAGSRAATL
jgi:omega-6 fatty acid desaturase (delta-12 desaturase)